MVLRVDSRDDYWVLLVAVVDRWQVVRMAERHAEHGDDVGDGKD